MDQIIGSFQHLEIGAEELEPGVRSLSSTDLSIFTELDLQTALTIGLAVAWVVDRYKTLSDTRLLREQLKEKGLSKKDLGGVDRHPKSVMEEAVSGLVNENLDRFFKNDDQGRRKELAIDQRIASNKIANRIDKGYNMDLRVEPFPKGEEESQEEKETSEEVERIQEIQSLSKSLQFLKLEGDPILRLPESKRDEEQNTGQKDRGSKT